MPGRINDAAFRGGNQLIDQLVFSKARFSIVSEDCWGGLVYQISGKPYRTPFVGMWVAAKTYLDLLEDWSNEVAMTLRFDESAQREYPLADYGRGKLGFMHYESIQEAESKFLRRLERFDRRHTRIKIDLRYDAYDITDVQRWNRLALPGGIAFCEQHQLDEHSEIHNAVVVGSRLEFRKDAAQVLSAFDWIGWIKTGSLKPPTWISNRLSRRAADVRRW